MKKTYKIMLVGWLVGSLAGPQWGYAAASGHYTDLLPNPTSAPNIVNGALIYNGYDWSIAPLAPTLTYGDGLSRVPATVFQSTNTININATTTASTMTAISGQGSVGSTTLPANWIANGRSIETTIEGSYSTPTAGPNWTWAVKLGTTTILNTAAMASPGGQVNQYFRARSVITIGDTGNAGTVFGSYQIFVASGSNTAGSAVISFSTGTISGAVTVDLTSQLTLNPVFTWGTANSSMTIRNVSVKCLN